MMIFWEKLKSKSSYHFPNSWWVREGILLNTCHLKKLWRGQEDKRKPRTSELFDSKTLKHFNTQSFPDLNFSVYCVWIDVWLAIDFFTKEVWSSGKGQARIGKGWLSRWKASKLEPLPRAYTKVGCHPPPPPPPPPSTRTFNFTQLMARWGSGEASGGKGRCVGSLWVTLGSL